MERKSKRAGIMFASVAAGCLLFATCTGASAFAVESESVSASTEVIVRTLPESLAISAVSNDVAGTVDEVRVLTLAVEATGSGTLAYRWTRTVDGLADTAFSHEGRTCPLDDVEAGAGYVYTVSVSDETGSVVSASVVVQVASYEGEYVYERITFPLLGVTIEANHRAGVDFAVDVRPLGTSAFSRLSSLAGDAYIRPPAYSIRLVGQSGDAPSFVGSVRISFPSPGVAAGSRAYAADEGESVEVLFVDEQGCASRIPGSEAAGWVTFETKSMGDFAVLAKEQQTSGSEDAAQGEVPSGSRDDSRSKSLTLLPGQQTGRLSSTGDAFSGPAATFALAALCAVFALAVSGACLLRARTVKQEGGAHRRPLR